MPPLTALTVSPPGYAETYEEVSKSKSNKEHMQMSKTLVQNTIPHCASNGHMMHQ